MVREPDSSEYFIHDVDDLGIVETKVGFGEG